eukprot:12886348-Prorocentrum_lima.AAC.1
MSGNGGKLVDSSPSTTEEEHIHPDWKSSELSQFEVEPYKAMYYKEVKVGRQYRRTPIMNPHHPRM